jgi:hypothetical protein
MYPVLTLAGSSQDGVKKVYVFSHILTFGNLQFDIRTLTESSATGDDFMNLNFGRNVSDRLSILKL